MTFTTEDLQRMFAGIAEDIAAERDHLCELDGAIGDGDHGLAMDAVVGAIPASSSPTAFAAAWQPASM
ncbi:hypothetical protein AB9F43_32960, partial [Rhizobium leguminosarum]